MKILYTILVVKHKRTKLYGLAERTTFWGGRVTECGMGSEECDTEEYVSQSAEMLEVNRILSLPPVLKRVITVDNQYLEFIRNKSKESAPFNQNQLLRGHS